MKNLKIGRKLAVSFLVVIVLVTIVGVVGIAGMTQISEGSTDMFYTQLEPIVYMGYAREHFQRMRVAGRNVALSAGDLQQINADINYFDSQSRIFLDYLSRFRGFLITPEALRTADEIEHYYNNVFTPGMQNLFTAAQDNAPTSELIALLAVTSAAADVVSDNLSDILEIRVGQASTLEQENEAMSNTLTIVTVAVLVLAIAVSVFLAVYISKLIATPIVSLTAFMRRAADTGELDFYPNEAQVIDRFSQNKDEIGQCISATASFMKEINHEMDLLQKIGEGDLTITPNILSDKDKVGIALTAVTDSLNNMFGEINSSTRQVASGSKQIADGAQSLAQGSTEQAASVQQLSSSISEIAQKTKTNADMAGRAAALASEIKASAEKGSQQMGEMMSAVKDISVSSQNIGKVIKAIDDIAFQTNILALNAAVEAARAGQHGKGFAVVAEEVRNLAAKSAEAAKDTESLIADSIEKAELGSRIADDTSASLVEIVTGIGESSQLIGDIATSSEEQSVGIAQINTGIDQVAQVVQQNSATAEESAAASQEMSGQSMMLEQLIAQFRLKDSQGYGSSSFSGKVALPPQPKKIESNHVPETSGDFGKY
ncbi:MAG: methyl-accepting chemotaxis protein [Oscillospiraceae bacterium]|nr:methyl-accepting chemotaxis protein [Oscillospiraceae bacterium]